MSWHDRRATRVVFQRGFQSTMLAIDGTWGRPCLLRDVSDTGAWVEVQGSLRGLNLREFFLVLSPNGPVFRRCELVRFNANEIGVRFLTAVTNIRKGNGRIRNLSGTGLPEHVPLYVLEA